MSNAKSFQSKVPFKSLEEVNQRIKELESQIEGGVRLVEEKKVQTKAQLGDLVRCVTLMLN